MAPLRSRFNTSALMAGQTAVKAVTKAPMLNLLDSVVESCSGALLILDDRGQALHTNHQARQICQSLDPARQTDQVPDAVWATCRPLSEEPDLFPGYAIILESEVLLPEAEACPETYAEARSVRIQAQRLDLDRRQPYFLVRLEEYCPGF